MLFSCNKKFDFSDHCMHLREMANGDKNLFSAERKMQKQKLKMEQQRQRQYEKEQKIEKSDIFNFINDTLSSKGKFLKIKFLYFIYLYK